MRTEVGDCESVYRRGPGVWIEGYGGCTAESFGDGDGWMLMERCEAVVWELVGPKLLALALVHDAKMSRMRCAQRNAASRTQGHAKIS